MIVFGYDVYTLVISLLVLLLGLIVGKVVENISLHFYEKLISRKARETGLEEMEEEMGLERGVRSLIANVMKYIVYAIAIIIVLEYLGLTSVSLILIEVIRYSPNIIGALLILVFGIMLGQLGENITLIVLSDDRIKGSFKDLLSNISITFSLAVKYYVYLIALTMAISQLGFAALTLNIIVATLSLIIASSVVILFYFGLKDFLPNILAGEYIKSNGLIKEGEKIKVDEFEGVVEEVGAIHTILVNKKDKYNVPNKLILNKVVKKN
jgi:hypothetical protein